MGVGGGRFIAFCLPSVHLLEVRGRIMCHMHMTPMSSFLIDTFARFDEGMMAEHVSRSA